MLSNIDAKIKNETFTDNVEIEFSMPTDIKEDFIKKIEETFASRIDSIIVGTHIDCR